MRKALLAVAVLCLAPGLANVCGDHFRKWEVEDRKHAYPAVMQALRASVEMTVGSRGDGGESRAHALRLSSDSTMRVLSLLLCAAGLSHTIRISASSSPTVV